MKTFIYKYHFPNIGYIEMLRCKDTNLLLNKMGESAPRWQGNCWKIICDN